VRYLLIGYVFLAAPPGKSCHGAYFDQISARAQAWSEPSVHYVGHADTDEADGSGGCYGARGEGISRPEVAAGGGGPAGGLVSDPPGEPDGDGGGDDEPPDTGEAGGSGGRRGSPGEGINWPRSAAGCGGPVGCPAGESPSEPGGGDVGDDEPPGTDEVRR
jgi:hypothetical protein